MPGSQTLALCCPAHQILLEGTRGPGKRVADYELVFTDSGWKQAGDVVMSDKLLAPDGTFTKLNGIFKKAEGDLHRVTFHDGTFLDVDGEHLWLVRMTKGKKFNKSGWQVKSTNFLRDSAFSWSIPEMWNSPGELLSQPPVNVCLRRIVSIELCGNGPATCFAVAHPSHTFVCKNFIVTHNTDTQLMAFRKNVGKGFGMYWRGIIFDREYKMLDDLVSKSQRWFRQFGDGAKFYTSKADYKWVWPTGEELMFRSVRRLEDYWNYHGQEFPFIGWNELTKFPTPDLYDAMLSCNRSSFMPDLYDPKNPGNIPLVVFSTTNPYGPGHNWVKKRWIDPAPPGVMMRETTEVYNPRTSRRENVTKYKVRLFCSYKENKFLSPEYIADLENITDEAKRRAWLEGDWEIVAGGALDDLWGPHNIAPRFQIPSSWRVDRSMDWGSTHPFSVGWWAEASGEECVLPDGTRWAPPAGSLFRIWELYGAEDIGLNKGVKMSPTDLADHIVKYDKHLYDSKWINCPVQPGPADNQIRDVRDRETATIADLMESRGVVWTASDKSAGSRKIGLELFRQRLQNSKTGEGPGIFFMSHCRAALETLTTLPRDPDDMDDVDTDAEDHVYDDCRYRILAGSNRCATSIPVAHPR